MKKIEEKRIYIHPIIFFYGRGGGRREGEGGGRREGKKRGRSW